MELVEEVYPLEHQLMVLELNMVMAVHLVVLVEFLVLGVVTVVDLVVSKEFLNTKPITSLLDNYQVTKILMDL